MEYDIFNYKRIIGTNGKLYLRISMEIEGKTLAEDTRIYWGSWVWGKATAEFRLCKRILKELKDE